MESLNLEPVRLALAGEVTTCRKYWISTRVVSGTTCTQIQVYRRCIEHYTHQSHNTETKYFTQQNTRNPVGAKSSYIHILDFTIIISVF